LEFTEQIVFDAISDNDVKPQNHLNGPLFVLPPPTRVDLSAKRYMTRPPEGWAFDGGYDGCIVWSTDERLASGEKPAYVCEDGHWWYYD
jgi:hypothetical protein